MSSRRAVTYTLLALVGVALVVGIVKVLDEVADPAPHAGGLPLSAILSRATPAQAPFEGLGDLKVAVGYDHCLRLAVADSLEERVAGLRDRTDLGPVRRHAVRVPGAERIRVHHVRGDGPARHRVLRQRRRAELDAA